MGQEGIESRWPNLLGYDRGRPAANRRIARHHVEVAEMGRYYDHSLPRRYRLIQMPLSTDIHEFAEFIVICRPQPQEIEVIGRRGREDTDRSPAPVKPARVRGTTLKAP